MRATAATAMPFPPPYFSPRLAPAQFFDTIFRRCAQCWRWRAFLNIVFSFLSCYLHIISPSPFRDIFSHHIRRPLRLLLPVIHIAAMVSDTFPPSPFFIRYDIFQVVLSIDAIMLRHGLPARCFINILSV